MFKRKKRLCTYSSRHLRRLVNTQTGHLKFDNSLLEEDKEGKTVQQTVPDTQTDCVGEQSTAYIPIVTNSKEIISQGSKWSIEEVQSDTSTNAYQNLDDFSSSSLSDIEYDLTSDFPESLDNSNTPCSSNDNLQRNLTSWALSHNITHSALGSLIEILKQHPCHSHLPNDPRTLFRTPRSSVVRNVPPGIYYHFGVESEVNKYMRKTNFKVDPNKGIELVINIDGLPISNSSTSAFWPILASLSDCRDVFMVGLYFGSSKPKECKIYLDDFIKECVLLTNNGIVLNNKIYKFSIHLIVCDAPAKSLILSTKSHGGYSSCPKCYVVGEYIEKRVCFPSTNHDLRTNEDFLLHKDEDYHTGRSPLEEIPGIRLVSNVPFDYMHVVCLGVVRKLIRLWLKGPLSVRIGHTNTEKISEKLVNLRKMSVPKEFVRKPRSLEFVQFWKATELRQFLLYSGPVVLKKILNQDLYDNFVSLHVAVRILCCKPLLVEFSDYSQDLMKHFVHSFAILYGKHYVSHNVHALIHLTEDAKNFGVLDEFSAFKFENFMQKVKGQLRKSEKPLQQIIRRYAEMQHNPSKKLTDILKGFQAVESSLHNNGPLPENCESPQYSAVKFEDFYLSSLNKADSFCGIKGGEIVKIKNIAHCSDRKSLVVIGNGYKSKENLYNKPCNSSLLNIYIISQEQEINVWPLKDVVCKYMRIPMGSAYKYAVLPLLHNDYLN